MKLRPLHDRVIIKRLDNERKTASGIVLPENAAEKPDLSFICQSLCFSRLWSFKYHFPLKKISKPFSIIIILHYGYIF